ncbi:hypothetical protein D049_0441B, partial [Vibrio parahaemolyticus VPTS-2010]
MRCLRQCSSRQIGCPYLAVRCQLAQCIGACRKGRSLDH